MTPIIHNPQILADIAETQEIDPAMLVKFVGEGWHVLASYERYALINAGGWVNGRQIETPIEQHVPTILIGRTKATALQQRVTELEVAERKRTS